MPFRKKAPVSWLIVGLGNPGARYENTRHNVGFWAIDELSRRSDTAVRKIRFHALTADAVVGSQGVLLMKPTTFMNLSGQAVGEAARFFKIPPEHILILSDDVDLPLGKLRIRKSGSAGGHNGLKNIIQHLGTDQFPRLKLGVGGKPHPDYNMADWVLGQLQGEDKKVMEQAVKDGKINSLGLSNYYIKELEFFLPQIEIKPVVVQNEIHPYYQETDVVAYIQRQGIAVEGWYPLGGRGYTEALLNNKELAAIGAKYGKTAAQVILRWNLQRNIIVIPGSKNPKHIKENMDIFDFSLTQEDMEKIRRLDCSEKHDWY